MHTYCPGSYQVSPYSVSVHSAKCPCCRRVLSLSIFGKLPQHRATAPRPRNVTRYRAEAS